LPDMPDLVAGLRSSNSRERLQATERVLALPALARIEPLAAVARDRAAPVDARTSAIGMLGRCGSAAASALVPLVADPDPQVRAAAVSALADVDARALASKRAALQGDASPLVRLEVVRNASAFPDREKLLEAALADPMSSVRRAALEKIGPVLSEATAVRVAKLFAGIRTRPERGEGREQMLEEEAALSALLGAQTSPKVREIVAPIAPRVIEIAGDPDAYDTDDHVEAGRRAAELLAAAGVPRPLVGALEAILVKPGLKRYVLEQVVLALVKSAPDEAEKVFARALARGGSHVPPELLKDGLQRAQRAQTGKS